VSNDYGESWTSIKSNLPVGVTVRVIREHPRNQNLLFLGTEFGAFVSFDRGGHWTRLKGNLPLVRVDDIQIHPRDDALVLATHGRSVWILDDLTSMERMSENIAASDIHLFDVAPATHFRLYGRKGNVGHKWFSAPNPPYGGVINYYLKNKPTDDVKITITDKSGKAVRELTGQKEPGLGRVVWDLRYNPATPPPAEGSPEAGGFFGPARGPRVPPGEYNVKVATGVRQATGTIRVEEDSRIQIAEGERGKLNDALMRVYELHKSAEATRKSLQNLKTQLTTLQTSLKDNADVPKSVATSLQSFSDQVTALQKRLVTTPDMGNAGPPLPDEPRPLLSQIREVAFGLDSYTAAPTSDELVRIDDLARQLRELISDVNRVVEDDAPRLNRQMGESGLQILNPGKRIPSP
jgi:hypothetical protein